MPAKRKSKAALKDVTKKSGAYTSVQELEERSEKQSNTINTTSQNQTKNA